MAKESNEGEFLKKKSVDHSRKRIENLSKANAVKEKVIHLDQLEFLPIFTGWEHTGQLLCIVDTSLSVLMTLRMCLRELCCLFAVWS